MITSSRCQGMGRAEELGCRPLGRAISFSSAMTILKTIQIRTHDCNQDLRVRP